MLNVFIVMFFVCAASFAANTVDLPVEEVSYSHPALEGARVDFLRARQSYRDYYAANHQVIQDVWKYEGYASGLARLSFQLAGTGEREALERLNHLTKENTKQFTEARSRSKDVIAVWAEVQEKYEYCMAMFAGYLSSHLDVQGAVIRKGLSDRLGFDKKKELSVYASAKADEVKAGLGL